MSYPGNESLAPDIQSRILDTFQQTLTLVEGDSLQEARLGCDFILRLDPMFEPARWLQDRLEASDGAIVVDDLKEAVAEATAAAAEAETELIPESELNAEATDEEFPESLEESGDDDLAVTQAKKFSETEAPTPATAEEVLDAPVATLDTESEKRIKDLLGEGQSAFEAAEYQSAIDAWSRIFLIDIDHPEANEKIELARKLKAEAERTIEEAYHEALRKVERGDLDEGRAALEKVIEMQPDHMMAREQLERLDQEPVAAAAPAAATPPPRVEPPAEDTDSLLAEPDLGAGPDLDTLTDVDAPAAPVPIPKPRPRKVAAEGGDKKKLLLYVGAGVLALVLVGGGLLIANWSSFFPNSAESVETPSERPDPIALAKELHAAGKTPTAIAQLKRLPPHHELYSEAQALVAQWEAIATAEPEDTGPTEADLAEFGALMEQARAAQSRREYLRVEELLTRAAAIQPLDEEAENLRLVAATELEPLRRLVAIFRQGEWELVLRDLWRMREDMAGNPDVDRLMVDSYYNLGVRALQRGDTTSAAKHFKEALDLAGQDAALERASNFALAYQNRPEDLLFRIYVKYLPFR